MKRIAYRFLAAISLIAPIVMAAIVASSAATAETRPHYGGTLRVMMQSAPEALVLLPPANAMPTDYWDMARTLSLVGDTLVKPRCTRPPAAHSRRGVAERCDARRWHFTLRRGVKFHDGSAASSAAIAQILGRTSSGLECTYIGGCNVD